MKRFLFAILWLAPVLAWLILAYLDPQREFLPKIAYPQGQMTQWLRMSGVLAALLFVGIQLWLAGSTMRVIRRVTDRSGKKLEGSPINLHVGWEFFWSVLPIALTLVVVLISYPTWRGM